MDKFEIRNMNIVMEAENEDMMVNGIVNVPNQRSQMLMDRRGKTFYEEIEKGAFQNAIDEADEILFLADHNNKHILASTKNDTLQIEETDDGVYMVANIVDTSYGQDTYKLIKSGLISNMSFGFIALEDVWGRAEDGTPLRTVTKMMLKEVSSVKNPAYTQSSIDARGLELNEVEVPCENNNVCEIRNLANEVEGTIEIREGQDDDSADLFFLGSIGNDQWDKFFDSGVAIPQDVVDMLEGLKSKKTVNIHINSPGGSVFGGYAIYNTLRDLKARKVVHVDSLCASIASVIAMCGDEVIMKPGATFMMHKPLCCARGNADDLRKQAEVLDVIQKGIVDIYMTKAKEGVTREQINDLVNAETYLVGSDMEDYFDIVVDRCQPKKTEDRSISIENVMEQFNIADENRKAEIILNDIEEQLKELEEMIKGDLDNE